MENSNIEQHIISVAKRLFIQNGFEQTSMMDIAAQAGLNRPTLHYYFRTKDRMFEAVFEDIINSFLPSIKDALLQEIPLEDRIRNVIDIYYNMLLKEPSLPIFMVREVQRDARHMLETASKLETVRQLWSMLDYIQGEMSNGKVRKVPLEFILYTFYGLTLTPFIVRPLIDAVTSMEDVNPPASMEAWKEQIASQMIHLLCV